MKKEELEIRYEMLKEAFEDEHDENMRLQAEVDRSRIALKVISDGLSILSTIAWDAKASEFESLFKDYAPFKNIMAAYFPKGKK